MLFFFYYIQQGSWNDHCTYFFNTYMFASYFVLMLTRKFSETVVESIDRNKCVQILVLGFILPLLLTQTITAYVQYFKADKATCKDQYAATVLYIVFLMFETALCIIYLLSVFLILIPTWIRKRREQAARQGVFDQL